MFWIEHTHDLLFFDLGTALIDSPEHVRIGYGLEGKHQVFGQKFIGGCPFGWAVVVVLIC